MKTTTPWILLASSLLYPPTAHAEVTLTFREQGVEAVLHSTPLAPDRKTINGGLETDSLTASLQYSDDDIQGAQSASATITAQPTFDDDFSNLTGFFGGGSVTAIAPTGAYRSVAEASFRLYFVTDQPVNFNLDFTALSPASYYDLYENIPNFSLNLGTGVKYDVRADDPSVHFAGTNGGGNFSQVIEPGQVGVELDFIASALDDEMPTASFDFFFLASIAPVGPTGLKWDEPAGGDFHTAGNWLGDTLPAVDEDILFDLPNTYAVTLDEDAQVGDMEIAQGQVSLDYGSRRVEINDLTIKGASGQTTLYVGSNAGVNTAEHGLIGHAFTIGANGRLTNLSTGQFYVGYVDIPENDPNSDQTKTDLQARKSVRVEDGGELITPNVRVDGPANAGGSGVATVAVDGAGSTWRARRLDIGGTYTGRVEVTKGGRLISVDVGAEALGVNVESPSDSTQSVIRVAGEAGSGERSTLLAANMTLGVDHRGRLEVVDGAGAGVDILRLGIRPMSHGTALIRGAGTTFGSGNGGFALIKAGDGGFGQLDIEAGAFVEANVTIGDGSIFALGDNRGIVNLSGEYTQLNSPNLNVGLRSAAELNISSGAKVSTSIAHFARYFNSTATVNISGTNSALEVARSLDVGGSEGDAPATLTVSDGALVDVLGDGIGVTNIERTSAITLKSGGKLNTTILKSVGTINIVGTESHLTSTNGLFGEHSMFVIDGGQLTNKEEYFDLRDSDLMSVFNGGRVNTARWFVGQGSRVSLDGAGTLVNLDPLLSIGTPADPTLESGEGLVAGTVNISNGARIQTNRLFIASSGVVTGDEGVIQLAQGQALQNAGSIEQGSSPGTLTIDGNLVQTRTGRIVFEVAGRTPDTLYDQLFINGNADIDGLIIFKFIDGFSPTMGDTFDLLNVAGDLDLSGAAYRVEGLADGFTYALGLGDKGLALVATSDGVSIPEPTTLALIALGGLVAFRRQRCIEALRRS